MRHFPWFVFVFVPLIGIVVLYLGNEEGKNNKYVEAIGEAGITALLIIQLPSIVAVFAVVAILWPPILAAYFVGFAMAVIFGRHSGDNG